MNVVALSPNGVDAYVLSGAPDALFVGTMDGVVLLRRDGGGDWHPAERTLPGVHISSLLVDVEAGIFLAGSHGRGIFRSTNGVDWVSCSDGLTSQNIYSLNWRTIAGRRQIYAGAEPAALFRMCDGDWLWTELKALRDIPGRATWKFPAPPNLAHVKHIDFDPRRSRRIYVSIEQGALLVSDDDGMSFHQIQFEDHTYVYGNDLHRVTINARNPSEIYLSGGDGITRSLDDGKTWRHVSTPSMRVAYPDQTFCSPLEDGIVFTCGAGARPGAWRVSGSADGTVARSVDYGLTWEQLDLPPLRSNIEAMTLSQWPGTYGFLAGTTDGEVFESIDRGSSWRRVDCRLPGLSKCIHAANIMVGRALDKTAARGARA